MDFLENASMNVGLENLFIRFLEKTRWLMSCGNNTVASHSSLTGGKQQTWGNCQLGRKLIP